jgi:hypothetical protein
MDPEKQHAVVEGYRTTERAKTSVDLIGHSIFYRRVPIATQDMIGAEDWQTVGAFDDNEDVGDVLADQT